MNDLFSKTWVRRTIKCVYVLFWTILLLFSLYYTDIIASGSLKELWANITSDSPLGLETRDNKVILPLFVAMFLFWVDAAYAKMMEINDSTATWKNHISSIMVGVFILLGIGILISRTHIGASVSIILFFTVCGIYKLLITPLVPDIKAANAISWEVITPPEDPVE